MRHGVDGRKFGRNTSHRVAMLQNLANNLIKQEQIVTTIEKAKETRRVTEKLITLAKRDTLNSRRLAFSRTRDNDVVSKLFTELTERYKARNGGYTRIVKISERRWGDAAKMAMIELVDHPKLDRKKKAKAALAEGAEAAATETATTDPFSKFRKIFAGGKKTGAQKEAKAAKAPASEKAEKAAAPKKAAAKKPAAKKTEK
ncbi:MAG: 50S ribosomal protein L17 [Bdellovibrionales bacterium]|nr:50S ribosomal protein L17 [Bdellovibrionales bacterium]